MGGCGASVRRCVSANVYTTFVGCSKEVDCEKVLRQLFVATSELAMYEIPQATKFINFHGHANCFTCFGAGPTGGASAISNVVNAIQVVISSSVGLAQSYTPWLDVCVPLFIVGVRLGEINSRVVGC